MRQCQWFILLPIVRFYLEYKKNIWRARRREFNSQGQSNWRVDFVQLAAFSSSAGCLPIKIVGALLKYIFLGRICNAFTKNIC